MPTDRSAPAGGDVTSPAARWEPGAGAVDGSDGGAAWAWPAEGLALGRAARVRPPPTRATAVAATARRRCFFHRASWRRRAARPCPVDAAPPGAAFSSGVPGCGAAGPGAVVGVSPYPCGAGRSSVVTASVGAVEATALWRRPAAGAMSGAYAPHPGHTNAPLRFRRHAEQ
ncbi:hypothetical protein EIZ62_05560 [Streptomyces ficellus]|uniref:Uncharacterized protein n=1 Tax=Streptomyces ficellus TaxID=1977088 RepID=A0A6I6FN49_9ACTN|nr:hypothetical protein EIZ62_05560 [Streptomyces ficellus]